MEKRINKQIEEYISEFKDNVKGKASDLGISIDDNLGQLFQYIYDYERLTLSKEDFLKRKRVKNVVNLSDRCCSKRANGEQCTRRRKDTTTEYCGTHLKGTPHGICAIDEDTKQHGHTIEVWLQDIQGIVYYIDTKNNVYQPEDVMSGKSNPKIIAKYIKQGDVYSIPDFNM